jgi:CO/xanthine dehydrogenase FAD-binding subunit
VGVSAGIMLGGAGEVADARIALSSVAPTPLRAREAEAWLRGRPPSEENLAEAAHLAAEETRPITDVRASASYRRTLARVLTLRTLRDAVSLAQQGSPLR